MGGIDFTPDAYATTLHIILGALQNNIACSAALFFPYTPSLQNDPSYSSVFLPFFRIIFLQLLCI